MRSAFRRVAGEDMEIDAYELQDILNEAFMKGSHLILIRDLSRRVLSGFHFDLFWNPF